jgi:hypothetical protein
VSLGATRLSNLANHLFLTSSPEFMPEALTSAKEGIGLHQKLLGTNPDMYKNHFQKSCNILKGIGDALGLNGQVLVDTESKGM